MLHKQLAQRIVGPEASQYDDWLAELETAVEQIAAVLQLSWHSCLGA